MVGDQWIKYRTNLAGKAALRRYCNRTGLSQQEVARRLWEPLLRSIQQGCFPELPTVSEQDDQQQAA
ncbi:hypothetical protein SH661x_001969 [Planctomicrobium sp. SH661]|uniref:hypothetical protein n=1 Tax=Planctomicrobium sp. SH661 TaxID=3448124 RepID=UPI003F5B1313